MKTMIFGDVTVNLDEVPVHLSAFILGQAIYYDYLLEDFPTLREELVVEKGIRLAIEIFQGIEQEDSGIGCEEDVRNDFRKGMKVAWTQMFDKTTLNYSEITPLLVKS